MESLLHDHPEIRQLRAISDSITEMRAVLARLEETRDAAIRRLDRDKLVSRSAMADMLGLARQRIWQIVNPATYRVGDEPWDIEVDGAVLERLDELWEQAVDRWESRGRAGDPGDHFDVDALAR